MIKFLNSTQEKPYIIFREKYDEAKHNGQKNIEAMSIATYNKDKNEIDSRFVNLKFIKGNDFIFFTNYNSPKSLAIETNNQVSALFFWHSINVQIRIKARIQKTSVEFNNEYFKTRSSDKNALAISSNQSSFIESYEAVIKKYNKVKKNSTLDICPEYWGGYSLTPYEFEFWVGHESRLNMRTHYKLVEDEWKKRLLQP